MVGATTARERAVTGAADFESFYRGEHATVYRALVLTLADRDLAAEAVDEAMVRAYQRWSRLSRYDNPAGWVYRVGLNWAISRTRRISARSRRSENHTEAADLALPDPELTAAVAALPSRSRAVVVLRFDLDWSLEQIAAALDVPVGTVKSRLHRALATLRTSLGDDHDA